MHAEKPGEIYRILPPYRKIERLVRGDYATPTGTVLGIPITPDTTPSSLRNQVRSITREAPASSLIAVFSADVTSLQKAMAAAAMAGEAGLPVLNVHESNLNAALRAAVTRPAVFDRAFRQWLRYAGVTDDERLIGLFGAIMEDLAAALAQRGETHLARPAHWTVDRMSKLAGRTPRTLRSVCVSNGLPTPREWEVHCRLLIHALLIQRNPVVDLTRLALALGYSDSSALTHAYRDHFRVTPTFVHERVGWQWLAWRWLKAVKRL